MYRTFVKIWFRLKFFIFMDLFIFIFILEVGIIIIFFIYGEIEVWIGEVIC